MTADMTAQRRQGCDVEIVTSVRRYVTPHLPTKILYCRTSIDRRCAVISPKVVKPRALKSGTLGGIPNTPHADPVLNQLLDKERMKKALSWATGIMKMRTWWQVVL